MTSSDALTRISPCPCAVIQTAARPGRTDTSCLVVRRDRTSGPPEPGFADAWQARLRTLLAEATTQGLTPGEVLGRSQDVLDDFEGQRS